MTIYMDMIRVTIWFVDYQQRAHLASRLMNKLYDPRLNSSTERSLTAVDLFNNLALVCVEDAQIKTAGRQQGRCSSSTHCAIQICGAKWRIGALRPRPRPYGFTGTLCNNAATRRQMLCEKKTQKELMHKLSHSKNAKLVKKKEDFIIFYSIKFCFTISELIFLSRYVNMITNLNEYSGC